MLRIVVVLAMVGAITGMVGLSGFLPVAAQDSDASATRSFNPATVEPDGEVVVRIVATGYGSLGAVTETLPAGFSYESSSLTDEGEVTEVDARTVRFTLQGADKTFTYTVTASSTAGDHDFSGVLRDSDRQDHTVGGAPTVTVEAPAGQQASATRSFNPATVEPDGEVVVRIVATGYGSLGAVTETLPAGFSYESSSLTDEGEVTEVDARTVRFTLQGADKTFTYTVTASSTAGDHDFSGVLRDSDRQDHTVGGAPTVTVEAPAGQQASATRSFNPATVEPDGEVVVRIVATGYGSLGAVTETLPAGFSYESSSLTDEGEVTEVDARTVRFTLQGADKTFTYTVTASSTAGDHDFSGVLRDSDRQDHTVGGAPTVTVEAPAGQQASATRSFNPATVEPDGEVVVRIVATGYGSLGAVTETLPAGFSYESSSLTDEGEVTEVDARTVRFTLQGADKTFTYTVTASSTLGSHPFSGTLRDSDRVDYVVGGFATVTVGTPSPPPPRPAPRPAPPANNPPTFPSDMTTRMIAENSPAGTNVGAPVTATDPNGDTLTYTLSGADMSDFRIDSATGQITVGPDTTLDYETQAMYVLAVTASDGRGGSATTNVMVNLTDVDEAPPADPCVNDLGGFAPDRTETLTGTWAADCASENRLGRYANFFSFTLEEATEVAIELTSDEDTYLYLLEGMGRDGMALHENDDIVPATDTNSQIQETLTAGTYTIEATTWGSGVTGTFTLTVSGLGDGTTPTPMPTPGPMPTDDPCRQTLPGDGAVPGEWASDCESAVGARGYARYYTFTLAEESEVTITLESDTDPYLYLRAGEAKSGDFLHENDDIVLVTNTNSRIEETLMAGTYTIEATTYGFGEMGSFTLTVSGLGDVTMPTPPQEPMPTDDPCRQTLSPDGPVTGQWTSDCESATRGSSYARYYTFTLTEASEVTITLESDTDPYLYLREGEAKSGDVVDENDDVVPGTDTNSRIQVTLVAGTYTIEATTYSSGEMGSFTLTVSGS